MAVRKDSLRKRGTSFLITLGPGQRSEAHNIHTYLLRYVHTHMQTIHSGYTQTRTYTDVTFLVNSSQMARFGFCAFRCPHRMKCQFCDQLKKALTNFDLYNHCNIEGYTPI